MNLEDRIVDLIQSVNKEIGLSDKRAAQLYEKAGGTLTLGSVLFAGADNKIIQDNAKFFWDNGNKRLGLGTTTPLGKVHLSGVTLVDSWMSDTGAALDSKHWCWQVGSGVGTKILRLRAVNDAITNGINAVVFTRIGISSIVTSFPAGNVGIGSATPDIKLDVRSSGPSVASSFSVGNSDNTAWLTIFGGHGGNLYPFISWHSNNVALRFATATSKAGAAFSEKMRITTTGRVGIGTGSPESLLHLQASGLAEVFRLYGTGAAINTATYMIFEEDGNPIAQMGSARETGTFKIQMTGTKNHAGFIASKDFVLDFNGNVGIGTVSPSSSAGVARFLHISNAAHAGVVFEDTTAAKKHEIWTDGGDLKFWNPTTGYLLTFIAATGNAVFNGCVSDGTCEIMKSENALAIIEDILKTGSGEKDEYDHERMDMKKIYSKYPFMIQKQIATGIDGKKKTEYFDKLGAKSDLIYVAIGQLKEKIAAVEAQLNN